MATHDFCLPDLGEGLRDGIIRAWHVCEGDMIEPNQIIAEIETAKSIVEIPSPFAGKVTTLHGALHQTILVGTPLLSVENNQAPTVAGSLPQATMQLPEATQLRQPEHHDGADPVLPAAKQSMAKQVVQYQNHSVPVHLYDVIPCPSRHALTAHIIMALTQALQQHPELNAHYVPYKRNEPYQSLHLGLAVYQQGRFQMHVISDTAQYTLDTIQNKLQTLSSHVSPKLHPTVVLSNFGSIAGRFGTPMLAPPSVFSLGIGRTFMENGQLSLPL